ncbi:nucleotidyltransferase domain-containing protein [Bacillaceae bacterium SIJ1]|uniref:nucleotidyltransferase domain-containing protein n=1 Tax=Litoribacterium kuwaitense TaxID=1398745 RepID=UPI0013ED68C6|nr:nucleotidyltransferase domain-containing protein [Litoribacterium kuwaitense]NGP43662.1 nucleotidyltransferase domain-containing protein [Litoribacterium kuwaitense]
MSLERVKEYVLEHDINAEAVLVGGSYVTGGAVAGSDMDVVIIDDTIEHYCRESVNYEGIPLEIFKYNQSSLDMIMTTESFTGIPFMTRLTAESVILLQCKQTGSAIIQKAKKLLTEGPHPISTSEIDSRRYQITDLLQDFEVERPFHETVYILIELLSDVQELICREKACWSGKGKWAARALTEADPTFQKRLEETVAHYFKTSKKEQLVQCVDEKLACYGGRLFAGYIE